MYRFNNYNYRSCLMASLFGGYGINWILKSYTFFDKNFYNNDACRGGIGLVMLNWAILSTYYIYPYLAAKNSTEIDYTSFNVSCGVIVFIGYLFTLRC